MKNKHLYILLFLVGLFTSGCGQTFEVKQLGKGDIDFVADAHRKESERLLFELMEKLYKRNPRELQKQGDPTIEAQITRLEDAINSNSPLIIDGLESVALIEQAFNTDFTGDRVFILVGGLLSMLHQSYGYHVEFFMFDKLDQEKLYLSARNLEVFSWRLRMTRGGDNQLLILSTQLTGEITNLSFERLITKLISIQEMMALIAADGDKRAVTGVTQGIAQMVFLPL
jgi:hypothetical protein